MFLRPRIRPRPAGEAPSTMDVRGLLDGNKPAARPASVRAFAIARDTVVILALATAANYALDRFHLCSSHSQASFILRCVRVTAAVAAEWRALWLAMLCCAVLEAAVAALALRLPCRRRALACLQLAVTMVRHCVCARAVLLLLAADPGYVRICIGFIFCFAAIDVANFVEFLRGDEK